MDPRFLDGLSLYCVPDAPMPSRTARLNGRLSLPIAVACPCADRPAAVLVAPTRPLRPAQVMDAAGPARFLLAGYRAGVVQWGGNNRTQ